MELLISTILFLSLILFEQSMIHQIDTNNRLRFRMVDPEHSGGGGTTLSTKITENELIDKEILEEVIHTKEIFSHS